MGVYIYVRKLYIYVSVYEGVLDELRVFHSQSEAIDYAKRQVQSGEFDSEAYAPQVVEYNLAAHEQVKLLRNKDIDEWVAQARAVRNPPEEGSSA